MLSHLLHCIWAADQPPPSAADLAAPSPITILPPFPGILNAAGERIVHCPKSAAAAAAAGAGLHLRLAQVTDEEKEEKEEEEHTQLVLTCSKHEWWNKGLSAPSE